MRKTATKGKTRSGRSTLKPGTEVVAKTALGERRLTVVSDEGGGWWKCRAADGSGEDLYNANILRPAAPVKAPAPAKPADGQIGPKLLQQFRQWAKSLLKVNPGYVKDPARLRGYVQGPNWDASGCEYAHYKMQIRLYGDELLGMFERLRAGKGEEGLEEYRSLLKAAGIEEAT
jgi:hypothetical protein